MQYNSQLSANSEPIQTQIHFHLSVPAEFTTYSESAYQWLVEVLDGLIDFGNQHGNYGVINLTEDEYEWLDGVLGELIYSVNYRCLYPTIEQCRPYSHSLSASHQD